MKPFLLLSLVIHPQSPETTTRITIETHSASNPILHSSCRGPNCCSSNTARTVNFSLVPLLLEPMSVVRIIRKESCVPDSNNHTTERKPNTAKLQRIKKGASQPPKANPNAITTPRPIEIPRLYTFHGLDREETATPTPPELGVDPPDPTRDPIVPEVAPPGEDDFTDEPTLISAGSEVALVLLLPKEIQKKQKKNNRDHNNQSPSGHCGPWWNRIREAEMKKTQESH